MVIMRVCAVNFIALVAIAAFDPALVLRNAKPDARVAKAAAAAITGNLPGGDNFSFWGSIWH